MGYQKELLDLLARAKIEAHDNGKETFDFATFAAVYPHDRGGRERLKANEPEEVQINYERMYYLNYPEASTIEEFANALDRVDESF